MGRGSRANLLEWDDPLALENSVELVRFYVLNEVSCTRWPADLDAVDFGRGSQTKVHAEITLREIASTAPDLVGLRDAARGKFDSRSDRQTIAFGPSQFQADPMTARNAVIAKKHGCAVHKLFFVDLNHLIAQWDNKLFLIAIDEPKVTPLPDVSGELRVDPSGKVLVTASENYFHSDQGPGLWILHLNSAKIADLGGQSGANIFSSPEMAFGLKMG